MNLRDLTYIIAVAENRHFGKAAEQCFVSQPTLSGQIKKLEEELGVSIFERSNRTVEVTPVGEGIIAYARKVIEQTDAIKALAQSYHDPLAGPLRIGAIPTLSPYLIPLILAPLRDNHPQMQLVLSEEQTDQLLHRLKNFQIDAALLATEIKDPELTSVPLFNEPFWVAYPRKHSFYEKESIHSKDLKGQDLLLLAKGNCLANQVMNVCDIDDRPNLGEMADLRASSLETLIQMISAGYGITLLPALAMGGSWTMGSGVVAQPLEQKGAYRQISLVFRKHFPRQSALDVFSRVILNNLPNTVNKL